MPAHRRSGFTLIEIMVVVGILGLVMMIGIPSIGRMVRKEGLTNTVTEITEACLAARKLAIMSGTMATMRIRPMDGRIEVGGGGVISRPVPVAPAGRYGKVDLETANGPVNRAGQVKGVQIPSNILIEMVDVNFQEYKDMPEALVRFYPNGTSDELTLVLHGDNQWRKITLELVTALPEVERF